MICSSLRQINITRTKTNLVQILCKWQAATKRYFIKFDVTAEKEFPAAMLCCRRETNIKLQGSIDEGRSSHCSLPRFSALSFWFKGFIFNASWDYGLGASLVIVNLPVERFKLCWRHGRVKPAIKKRTLGLQPVAC